MTAPTIKKINAAIAQHGVEIVKGDGYFYFADIGDAFIAEKIRSVYTMFLRDMSLEQWVLYVQLEVKK